MNVINISEKTSPLHEAAVKGNLQMVQTLLATGANPNYADSKGRTPLHKAAYHEHIGVVRILLDAGADPNYVDTRGWTPQSQGIFSYERVR